MFISLDPELEIVHVPRKIAPTSMATHKAVDDYKGPLTSSDGYTLKNTAMQAMKDRMKQMMCPVADVSHVDKSLEGQLKEVYGPNKAVLRAGLYFLVLFSHSIKHISGP